MTLSAFTGENLYHSTKSGVECPLRLGSGFLFWWGSDTVGWLQQTGWCRFFPFAFVVTLQLKIPMDGILRRLSKFLVTLVFCNACPSGNGNSKYIPKCLAKALNGLAQPLWKTSRFRAVGICGGKHWTMNEILAHCEARGIQWQWEVWIVNQVCHHLVNYEKPLLT